MCQTFDNSVTGYKRSILKNITLFIFYILPKRATSIYVSLSMVALIYNLKEKKFVSEGINNKKLSSVLKIAVNDEIMILPNFTLSWFWADSILDKTVKLELEGKTLSLKSIVASDDLFFKHIRYVLDELIDSLPRSFKSKLNLNNVDSRFQLKHNVMEAVMFA